MGKLSGWTRIRILERDHYTCVYCGRQRPDVVLEVDHVIPRSKGGSDNGTNLVTACRDCNNGKRAGLVALPAYVVLTPLLGERARRIQHLAAIEHAYGARSVTQVVRAVEAGASGSLNSGSSRMDRPDRRLVRAACDLCTYKADTVHFLPWIPSVQEVLFACGAHDPGGYWALIETFDSGDYTTRQHLLAKYDGWLALAVLDERLNGRKPRVGIGVNWRQAGGSEIVRVWA